MSIDTSNGRLVWKEEYNVNVKEIDDQHKMLFSIINALISEINATPDPVSVGAIIAKIGEYKQTHFATEEKYFHAFGYEGSQEHEAEHRQFNETLAQLQQRHGDDTIAFAFALVDYLEDWLIKHLMGMDQKYKQCFHEHGLT